MEGEGRAGDNSTIVQAAVGGGPQGQETGPLPLLRGGVLAQAQVGEGWGETGAGSRREPGEPSLGRSLPWASPTLGTSAVLVSSSLALPPWI